MGLIYRCKTWRGRTISRLYVHSLKWVDGIEKGIAKPLSKPQTLADDNDGGKIGGQQLIMKAPPGLHPETKARRGIIIITIAHTLSVSRTARNFFLSPISIQPLMHGNSSLMVSSMRMGATFSPPAVMISSVMVHIIQCQSMPEVRIRGAGQECWVRL